jgi:hypothetical protein
MNQDPVVVKAFKILSGFRTSTMSAVLGALATYGSYR